MSLNPYPFVYIAKKDIQAEKGFIQKGTELIVTAWNEEAWVRVKDAKTGVSYGGGVYLGWLEEKIDEKGKKVFVR